MQFGVIIKHLQIFIKTKQIALTIWALKVIFCLWKIYLRLFKHQIALKIMLLPIQTGNENSQINNQILGDRDLSKHYISS